MPPAHLNDWLAEGRCFLLDAAGIRNEQVGAPQQVDQGFRRIWYSPNPKPAVSVWASWYPSCRYTDSHCLWSKNCRAECRSVMSACRALHACRSSGCSREPTRCVLSFESRNSNGASRTCLLQRRQKQKPRATAAELEGCAW